MKFAFTFVLLAVASGLCFAQKAPDKEIQIKMAILAAPQEQRENVTVMGYSGSGKSSLMY